MNYYPHKNVARARQLRKNMTPWERKLWYLYLRGYPVRFQRQKTIGPYIVDFYCAACRLVVELDGGGHYNARQETYDLERTAWLNGQGIRVLRLSNLEIDRSFEEVCSTIDQTVSDLRT